MLAFLKQHKGKVFLLLLSIPTFIVLLFPFGDLSDFVTTKVAQITGNQVYVQFDEMQLSALPAGLQLSQVLVETAAINGLKAEEIVFTPSVSSLIFQKPAGSLLVSGILGGNVKVSLSPGKKTEEGVQLQDVEIKAEKLSLAQIQGLVSLPVPLKGNLNLDSMAKLDLAFVTQPDVELTLVIEQFELPQASVNTMMGPVTLPDLKLGNVELVGRLSGGKFEIQKSNLGKTGDELIGNLKGTLGMTLINNGGRIIPQFSDYDLVVDLNIKKSLEDRATLFLALLQSYKTPTPDGGQYKFKVAGSNFINPPSITSP
jgi:type II secretion system protein N